MAEVLCRCTACTTKFKVDAKYAGKKARCPKCTLVVEVPAAGSEPISGSTTVVPANTAPPPTKAPPPKTAAPMPPPQVASTTFESVPAPPPPAPPAVNPAPAPSASSSGFPALNTSSAKTASASRVFIPPQIAQPTPASPEMPAPHEAALETSADAVALEDAPASDPFAIQIKKPGKKAGTGTAVASPNSSAAGGSADAANTRPAKNNKSSLPLILGAGGLLAVAAIAAVVVIVMTGQFSGTQVAKNTKGGGKGTAASQTTGRLVIDWPDADRAGGRAALKINKRTEPLTAGTLHFDLTPGEHTILMQRAGYGSIETKVTITKGETTTYKPVWSKDEFGSSGPTVATKSPGGTSGGTDFQVGMATGPTIAGFEGFTQNFYRAKEIAAKEQKDILIVFGRSDTDSATKALSQALTSAKSQWQSFIPVVVDFPQTSEGQGNVQDLATNNAMAQEFGLRRIPTLVLLDHQAKSYYHQDKWPKGPENLTAYLQEAATARTERDQLWAAVKGESLEPAAKFVEWLINKNLITRFGDELTKWTPVAKRLDPNNEQGHLEAFVEAQFIVDASNVLPTDETGIKQMVAPLEVWLQNQRFKNEDRGVRVHMRAAAYLGRSGQGEDAGKHLVRAGSYNPTDPDLKNALAGAKTMIERGRILSSGTGFVISEAGYILTNHHVIAGRGKVVVRLPDGKTTVDGQVIAQDDDRDMALVKIELPAGLKLTTLTIATAAAGRGSNVAALGYPGARSVEEVLTFTEGAVSALPSDATNQMLKLDVRVNPGNSGGPLCDNKGFVVGMVTAKTRTSADTDSYGMAVPSAELTAFLAKHLPPGAPRGNQAAPPQPLAWNEVDAQVSPGVLLILKME